MDSDPKTLGKFDAALALIARLAKRAELEAIRQNAIKRGATVVAEAATARLEALQPKPKPSSLSDSERLGSTTH